MSQTPPDDQPTQVVRYLGQSAFSHPWSGLDVDPDHPLEEVSRAFAAWLVEYHKFEYVTAADVLAEYRTGNYTLVDSKLIRPSEVDAETVTTDTLTVAGETVSNIADATGTETVSGDWTFTGTVEQSSGSIRTHGDTGLGEVATERVFSGSTGSSGQWIHAAQIQTEADTGSGAEASYFGGTVMCMPRSGDAAIRGSHVDFGFATRNMNQDGFKPIWFNKGNGDDETQTLSARVYRDANGFHHVYFKRPPFTNILAVRYVRNRCVEHWTTGSDPTTDANLTLVWDSQTGDTQVPQVGTDRLATETYADTVADVPFEKVTPSNFQTVINNATTNTTFVFEPGDYQVTAELSPPKGSTLLCDGVSFHAAYNGRLLFVDQGVTVRGGEWDVPGTQTHTTDVLTLDVDRAGDYLMGTGGDTTVELHTTVKANSLSGNNSTALGIHGDGAVGPGNLIDLTVSKIDRAIYFNVVKTGTDSAFITGTRWDLTLWHSRIFFEQEVGCVATPEPRINIQSHPSTEYIVNNKSTNGSVKLHGMVWDVHVVTAPKSQLFTGPGIVVESEHAYSLDDAFDGSADQVLYGRGPGGIEIYSPGSNSVPLTVDGTVQTTDTTVTGTQAVRSGGIREFGEASGTQLRERVFTNVLGSTAEWIHVAQIQTEASTSAGAENSQFMGELLATTRSGDAAIRSTLIEFHFATRNMGSDGFRPVWFSKGDTSDDTQTVSARVYRDADGYHHLYIKRPPYNTGIYFKYLKEKCVEQWAQGVDPTADATLTLVWDSQTDAAQTPRVGPNKLITEADGTFTAPVSAPAVNDTRVAKPADGGAGIQAAHDALPSTGGTIELRPGTYTVSSPITISKSDVTVRGPGNAVVQAAAGLNNRIFTDSGTPNRLTFEGFEVDGNKAGQDVTLAGTNYYAFGTLDGSDLTFRDLHIHDTAYTALSCTAGSSVTVENCRFENTGKTGAQSTAAHVSLSGGTGHTIRGNYFADATDNAFYTRNTTGVTFTENTCDHVFVNAVDTGNTGLSITNNDIVGTPDEGSVFIKFALDSTPNRNVTIANNRLYGQDGAAAAYRAFIRNEPGITVENATIHGNIVEANGVVGTGIEWDGDGRNLTIANNTIQGTNGNGIICSQAHNVSITGNTVRNCNTGGGTFTWGIRANRDGPETMHNVTITNNRIIDDRATPLHYEGLSVAATGADWITVGNNTVRGATNALRNISTSISHLIQDGLGYNSGDPNSAGQWNGNGQEGLTVIDTGTNTSYRYANGAWRAV